MLRATTSGAEGAAGGAGSVSVDTVASKAVSTPPPFRARTRKNQVVSAVSVLKEKEVAVVVEKEARANRGTLVAPWRRYSVPAGLPLAFQASVTVLDERKVTAVPVGGLASV